MESDLSRSRVDDGVYRQMEGDGVVETDAGEGLANLWSMRSNSGAVVECSGRAVPIARICAGIAEGLTLVAGADGGARLLC